MTARPRILVFDSGLGGLTVLAELRRARADADIVYLADTAAFPYGGLAEDELVARVAALFAHAVAAYRPDVAVIACNTASTLVLPHLRAAFSIPFVGTVPAIKPAAAATRTGRVSVLATPGTVARDYTRALIDTYAFHVDVTLVGATRLAGLAEAHLRGGPVADADIRAEIAPAFVGRGATRTDTVVLGCTHYPLLLDRLGEVAPWTVTWIDPAPAIAGRAVGLLRNARAQASRGAGLAVFTALVDTSLPTALARFGLDEVRVDAAPFDTPRARV